MATMTDASENLAPSSSSSPSSFPSSSATDVTSYITSLSSALVTSKSIADVESVLDKCEEMELSGDERITPELMHSIQVTQMASLMILGEYHHARHLFRRFSSSPISSSLIPADDVMFALWDATRSMMKHDAPSAFASMAEFASSNEPSASLMERIADVLRDRTAEELARIHLRMKPALAAARLGLPSQESASGYLKRRGWTVVVVPPDGDGRGGAGAGATMCLVPPARTAGEGSRIGGGGSVEARLRDLTNVVAFMEQERMNA